MPDLYVSEDTTGFTDFYYNVSAKGLLENFLFNHLINLPKVSSNAFIKEFEISDEQYNKFVSIASLEGIKANPTEIKISRPIINRELKALLARYYFGDEVFYKVLNSSDKVIARSLQVLGKEEG